VEADCIPQSYGRGDTCIQGAGMLGGQSPSGSCYAERGLLSQLDGQPGAFLLCRCETWTVSGWVGEVRGLALPS
jgi:hypothetical protein